MAPANPGSESGAGAEVKKLLKWLDSGFRGCVVIGKTTHISLFVIPDLTRNLLLFQSLTLLDAGSVIPDVIRDRHDRHKLDAFFELWHSLESRNPVFSASYGEPGLRCLPRTTIRGSPEWRLFTKWLYLIKTRFWESDKSAFLKQVETSDIFSIFIDIE